MKLKNRAEEIFRDGDLIFTSERNLGARNVQMDYDIVRANQPAVVQTGCRWIIGDVTEVLDRNTWKLGKIAKMLKNNYFVIRLADCIQLKEFHISSLRVPASPHSNNQYSVVDKKSEAKLAQRGQIPSDALPGRTNKKRKSTADTSFNPRRRTSRPENASRACVLDGSTTQNRFQFIREEAECSVASCSINDPDTTFTNAKKLQSLGFPDDAMSACPCTSGMEDDDAAAAAADEDDDDEPAAIAVHELELEAYQSTMRALYASGPLTWEQESLLTNLRLSLNISNEEHLLQQVFLVGDVQRQSKIRQQRLLLPRQWPRRVQRSHRRLVRLQLQLVDGNGRRLVVIVFVGGGGGGIVILHAGGAWARGHGVVREAERLELLGVGEGGVRVVDAAAGH